MKVHLFENEAALKEPSSRAVVLGGSVAAAAFLLLVLLVFGFVVRKRKKTRTVDLFATLFAPILSFSIPNSFTFTVILFLMKMSLPEQRKRRPVERDRAVACRRYRRDS